MNVVHLSVEWYGFTGVPARDAMGRGWIRAVHHDDRGMVNEVLDAAASARCGYTMAYRLLNRDGSSLWVSDAALPSYAVDDRRFIGLMGSITEIDTAAGKAEARGSLGAFDPPPPRSSTLTAVSQDLMADYLLLARAMADREGEHQVAEAIDLALYLTRNRFDLRRRLDRTVH